MGSAIWTSRTYESYDGTLHLSCAETAKLVRKALKQAFPGSKFSVRSSSYSMGASISVSWTDGPPSKAVDSVVGPYRGADFDGMVDLKTGNIHWIEPDGSAVLAYGGGQGSTRAEIVGDPPSPNARLVRFGADYIHCSRRLSPEVEERIKDEVAEFIGGPFPSDSVSIPVSVFTPDGGGSALARDEHSRGNWPSSVVHQISYGRDYSKPCACPADARYGLGGGRYRCSLCGA